MKTDWNAEQSKLRLCPMCGEPAKKAYGRYCSKGCKLRYQMMLVKAAENIREIERINEEARALGLTYGQYVARRGIR